MSDLERRLRTGLDSAGESISVPDGDVAAVVRRGRTRRLLTNLTVAAVVVVAVGAVWQVTRSVTPAPFITPNNTTPTTAAPTTEVPTTLLPLAAPGTVLIADREVVALQQGDGYIAYLADRVVSDGAEGIVIQIDQRLNWIEPTGASQVLVRAEDIAADQGPVTIRLEDFARIDGKPHVLFTVTGGTFEEPYQEVWVYDLGSGASYSIYRRAEFESNITRVSLANDVMVVTISEEGTTYLELFDGSGQPIDYVAPFTAGAGTAFDSPVIAAVLSPDGTTMLYAQIENVLRAEDGSLLVDLVAWDLAAGAEVDRLRLDMGNSAENAPAWPGRLDYDGTTIVLGRELRRIDGTPKLTPLLISSIDSAGIVELEVAGVPSLAKE